VITSFGIRCLLACASAFAVLGAQTAGLVHRAAHAHHVGWIHDAAVTVSFAQHDADEIEGACDLDALATVPGTHDCAAFDAAALGVTLAATWPPSLVPPAASHAHAPKPVPGQHAASPAVFHSRAPPRA
jgi:hypothetical protein